ncbi:MAG: nucleoside-diphosphate sugar epimerase/dehydratase [bacterium]|nr:nucleoside-diphosphate sugar epimerase/dehydratase [bacterium]
MVFRFLRKNKNLLFLIADAILIVLAIYLAFVVRFEGNIPERNFKSIFGVTVLTLIFSLPLFSAFKLYSFSWAYVSTQELISLVKATGVSFFLLVFSFFVLKDHAIFFGFPRSTLIISFIFIFIFTGGIRFAKRIYLQLFQEGGKEGDRTLIVGAGNAGEQILRSILNFKNRSYRPVGFVDDDPTKQGILIHGIKVLGKIKDIPEIVEEKGIEEMIIALPSVGSKVIKDAVDLGRRAKLKKIKIIPPFSEIINNQVSIRNLRGLEVEDLLGREPVSLDETKISDFLNQKRILITGAAGSIGSELSRQVAKFNPASLLLFDQDETGIFNISEELKDKFPKLDIQAKVADILDEKKTGQIFSSFSPQAVFHAAAYKHVPLMEGNSDEAVKNNILGTEVVAGAALRCGAEKFIFISTDKAIRPASIMGATKRAGEMICQLYSEPNQTKFISVRFGNVLNSRGSVIPIFREQIKKGGPVEITHPDMKRYFMITSEACLLVMQAGAMGQGGEVFVLDMGQPIKILDLAKEIIRLSGFEPDKDIPIVFTGIRPGEKLFEEVLSGKEEMLSTQNQKIFIAKLPPISGEMLKEKLVALREVAYKGDKEAIVNILKEIIPDFQHG